MGSGHRPVCVYMRNYNPQCLLVFTLITGFSVDCQFLTPVAAAVDSNLSKVAEKNVSAYFVEHRAQFSIY